MCFTRFFYFIFCLKFNKDSCTGINSVGGDIKTAKGVFYEKHKKQEVIVKKAAKLIGVIILLVMIAFSFAACNDNTDEQDEKEPSIGLGLMFIGIGIAALIIGFALLKEGNGMFGLMALAVGVVGIIGGFRTIGTVIVEFFKGLFGG